MGGSSGGGGSSGKVDYPQYMKDKHKIWLNEIDGLLPTDNPYVNRDAPDISVLVNANPLGPLAAYIERRLDEVHTLDFSPNLSVCVQQPTFYRSLMQMVCYTLSFLQNNNNIVLSNQLAVTSAELNARLTEIDNLTDLEGSFDIETVILPRFEAGMRDINAVQMSTFVVGRAVIEGVFMSKVAELREQLKNEVYKLKAANASTEATLFLEAQKADRERVQRILGVLASLLGTAQTSVANVDMVKLDIEKYLNSLHVEIMKLRESSMGRLDGMVDAVATKQIEFARLVVVAMMEHATMNADFDEKRYRWPLENYQYAANMLGAVSGGVVQPGNKQPNKFASALGGALSGAASGAMIGSAVPGIGTAIGAGVGAIMGAGMSMLS